jgi:hypothetical protein
MHLLLGLMTPEKRDHQKAAALVDLTEDGDSARLLGIFHLSEHEAVSREIVTNLVVVFIDVEVDVLVREVEELMCLRLNCITVGIHEQIERDAQGAGVLVKTVDVAEDDLSRLNNANDLLLAQRLDKGSCLSFCARVVQRREVAVSERLLVVVNAYNSVTIDAHVVDPKFVLTQVALL